jgi:bifunctional enzyme CysN/CysC
MPWYNGNTLLHILENVHVTADKNLVDFRYPVQYVVRPHLDFRGFAGRIASGTITEGEKIVVLPSGKSSRVKTISTYDGEVKEAFAGQSVVISLTDEIDVSRGDMIVRKQNLPCVSNSFEAIVCWMDEQPMDPATPYYIKHTTRTVKTHGIDIVYKIDVNTLHRQPAKNLLLNEIGRVEITTAKPLYFDSYKLNHATGSFILIDPVSNHTVAAGMIRGLPSSVDDEAQRKPATAKQSPNVSWEGGVIDRTLWEKRNGHRAAVLWFTGLSGAGKSTVARKLVQNLFDLGCQVILLDGDNVRHGLCGDLGFSGKDRSENIRRICEAAKLFFVQVNVTICTFISPFQKDREYVRSLFPEGRFIEVFVQCDLNVCKRRDPKGLYSKAMKGEIIDFTGVTSPYENPEHPEIIIETDIQPIEECVESIKKFLSDHYILE